MYNKIKGVYKLTMTNQERQIKLDKEKWFASQKAGRDLAGAMGQCNYCNFQAKNITEGKVYCSYGNKPTDKIRVKFPCATAYNKMIKIQDEKIAKKHGII